MLIPTLPSQAENIHNTLHSKVISYNFRQHNIYSLVFPLYGLYNGISYKPNCDSLVSGELNIFYLLKILSNGIGHKLSQQLFKTRSLQFTTNYIHDSNHTMKCINLYKDA